MKGQIEKDMGGANSKCEGPGVVGVQHLEAGDPCGWHGEWWLLRGALGGLGGVWSAGSAARGGMRVGSH